MSELGPGFYGNITVWQPIPGANNVVEPAENTFLHSALIRSDRFRLCTIGLNAFGEMGDNTTNTRNTFACDNYFCMDLSLPSVHTSSDQGLGMLNNPSYIQNNCDLIALLVPSGGLPATFDQANSLVLLEPTNCSLL